MRDIGKEVLLRMYLKGVCANALSDWLGISNEKLMSILISTGKMPTEEPAIVKIVVKCVEFARNKAERCKYCKKPGIVYHLHQNYRALCLDCLAEKLNYGEKCYEQYAWTLMTKKEIYSALVDCYVGGFTATASGWEECITADYIGTLEGVTEWYNWQDQCRTIIPSRFPRRSKNIVENSDIDIAQLIGVWHNRPVETEKKHGEVMEIFSDGTGIYTDCNGRKLLMDLYIDSDILNISMDDEFTLYRGPFYFRKSDNVKDLQGITHIYPCFGWVEYADAKHGIRGKYYKTG